ncbi:MAG TPA: hypothetical protein VEZ47_04380 [Gemmatirosa sp.]|jgi:hypothetical protein|nr:hypothetical protein [Gemmatirosa sp.]
MRSIRSTSSILALTLTMLPVSMAFAHDARDVREVRVASESTATQAAQDWGGVYRLVLTRGGDSMPMRLVLERSGTTMEATIISAESASPLQNVRVEGGMLHADVTTSRGAAQLVLRDTGAGLEGTLVIGKRSWSVSGDRSS